MTPQVELERPATPPRAAHRRSISIVSACTAIWLVLQVAAGISTSSGGWPISGIPMYADARTSWSERDVQVTTESGRSFRLRKEHLDLRGFELQRWTRDNVGDVRPRPNAESALAELAAAYNRRHIDDPAVRLERHVTVRSLDGDHPVLDEHTIEWEAG